MAYSCRGFIAKSKWRFARTMRYIPHEYCLRTKDNEIEFLAFAMFIRKHGYQKRFGNATYTYLDVDGYTYWTMPQDQLPDVDIINRTKTEQAEINRKRISRRDQSL